MEKEQIELPTQLPRTVITQKDRGAKKRKPIAQRPEDDALTGEVVNIANRHITALNSSNRSEESGKRQKSEPPAAPRRQIKLIPINTDMKPLEKFDAEHPPEKPELIPEDPEARYVVSASALQRLPSLRHILSRKHRYFVQRNSAKVEEGILAEPKPVISAKHIAKVLFEPHSHFGPCVYAATNECAAQNEPPLRHPLSDEPLACMAYRSPEEMDSVASGLQSTVLEGGMCEFCERYAINMYVLQRGVESHVTEIERPSRYYKSDMPGEYSRRFMIQPTVIKGARFTDGVFGDVRYWSTADFVPLVGIIRPGESVISETCSVEQYSSIPEKERVESGCTYVRGWKEIGGLYDLNEHALLETHQISPYEKTYTDTELELDLTVVLRGYFERRELHYPGYARVYSDLMECAQDPTFLTTCPKASEPPRQRWAYWCLHKFDEPPDPATHRLYYTLLVRLNLSQQFLESAVSGHSLPPELTEKMRLFIDAHRPLIEWLDTNQATSDEALLSLVHDETLQIEVPVLLALYPRYETHYRRSDCEFINYTKRSYSRLDPLEATQRYYRDAAELRFDLLLHSNLPTVEQLLYKVTPKSLSNTSYARVTAEYEKLCARLSTPRQQTAWPDMPSKLVYNRDASSDADVHYALMSIIKQVTAEQEKHGPVSRKEWRVIRNTEVLRVMRAELTDVLANLEEENNTYALIMSGFAKSVFCPFMDTVRELFEMPPEDRALAIECCHCFVSLFPPDSRIEIDPLVVNGQSWDGNIILLAALVRVYICESLHTMELPDKTNLRYNLRLLRNSHLRLVRKITEDRSALLDDEALLHCGPDSLLNTLDVHMPDPKIEVYPGCLPNVLQGLVNVDFMGNNGMDEQPLIKILFKVLDRCCNGREFPIMLNKMCEQNPDFNRLVMLMLELSLKGLYEHDTETVTFARSLSLDEMFECSGEPETTAVIHRFVRDNPTLAKEAISESLCYMLDFVPPLRDMLNTAYEDLDDWHMRIVANMDMVRHCYSATGDFSRVEELVYRRVHLGSSKKIYRHAELSFVNFVCDQIREFDIVRYGRRIMVTEDDQITTDQRIMVDAFIRSISPVQVIKLEALKLIFMSEATLDVIGAITQLFDDSGAKLAGSGAKRESSNPVHEQFCKLELTQYMLMSYFFESLRRYQNVRVIRLNNLNVLERQFARLCERRGVQSLQQLPELATKIVYSPCCAYFKNAFPVRQDQAARGFDEVIHNHADGTDICGKKEHKSSGRQPAAPRAIRLGKKVEIFNTKVARQQERENKKPVCRNTEVMVIDVLGEVVETQSSAKIPKSKRQGANGNKRRRKNLPLPTPPFWITPCCGIIYEYNWMKWTPNGYACGVCKENSEVADSLLRPLCMCCNSILDAKNYRVLRLLDDVYTNTFRRMIFCQRCLHPWKHFGTLYCASHIIRGMNDAQFPEAVALRYT